MARATVTTYSGTTGRQLDVLYRYPDRQCLNSSTEVLWTDPSGSHVIIRAGAAEKGGSANLYGYIANGRFTALPALAAGNGGAADNAGCIAF